MRKHIKKRRRSTTDVVAEAMARLELTTKGNRFCVWKRDWSVTERRGHRRVARVALAAAKKYQATL